jgi:nucleoside-diphosphate-sugar epimerase
MLRPMSSGSPRVLVTGGHGFVGSHLVERLLAEGARVRCLNRRRDVPERLRGLDVEVVPGDLADGSGLAAAVAGRDEVWHLGALTRSRTRREMHAVNAEGTLRLAEAARAAGVGRRFVFCSSLAAAGPSPDGRPLTEAAPLSPVTAYGRSKLRAEEHLARLAGDLPFTVVRPPAVYGPRDGDFLGLFRAAARGWLPSMGDPGRRLSLVFVADLVAGLLAAGRSGATLGRAWFATAEPHVLQSDLADAVAGAVGRRGRPIALPTSTARLAGTLSSLWAQVSGRAPLLTRERVGELGEGHWVCTSAGLTAATGWRARTGLAEGFATTAAWYRDEGLL